MARHDLEEDVCTQTSRFMARIVCQDKHITFCATVHDRALHSRRWSVVEAMLDRLFRSVEPHHCRACWEREVDRHWPFDDSSWGE